MSTSRQPSLSKSTDSPPQLGVTMDRPTSEATSRILIEPSVPRGASGAVATPSTGASRALSCSSIGSSTGSPAVGRPPASGPPTADGPPPGQVTRMRDVFARWPTATAPASVRATDCISELAGGSSNSVTDHTPATSRAANPRDRRRSFARRVPTTVSVASPAATPRMTAENPSAQGRSTSAHEEPSQRSRMGSVPPVVGMKNPLANAADEDRKWMSVIIAVP
jgi:hypothetical protein